MFNRIKHTLRGMFSGDLSCFGGPIMNEDAASRVRAEQISIIFQYLSWTMLANVCNALVLVVAFRRSSNLIWASAWAVSIFAYVFFVGTKSNGKRGGRPTAVSKRAVRRVIRNALVLGTLWAAMPLLLFAHASNSERLIITCLCAGMLGGGVLSFASIPVAAIAFVAPLFIASGLVIARNGDEAFYLIALLMVIYTFIMLRGVFVHALELSRNQLAQIEAQNEARKDALTNLPNRAAFQEYVEGALSRLAHKGETFALLYLDLNEFKAINDKMGHAAGDTLLVQVADRLERTKRPKDTVVRLGGDEFVLVATNVDGPEEALTIADQIIKAVDAPFMINDLPVISSVAIGVALAPKDGADFHSLLKSADTALYGAKRSVGKRIRCFDPQYEATARDRRAIGNELSSAVERQELQLVYQPLLDLIEHRIVGCEALLRWNHPTRGTIPPSEFITIAEETQLIHSIGQWVVRQACQTAAMWPNDTKIAVNFSVVQFQNARILPIITNALADAGITPSRLEIEVTESVLISEDQVVLAMLDAIYHLGVRIAIDDFGTGYSSLSCLGTLPFNRIKIDQSFTRDLLINSNCSAIVKSLISLAHNLKMGVTAEGVETTEQLSRLRAMGCSEVQGYLIGTPQTATEIFELFDKQSGPVPSRLVNG